MMYSNSAYEQPRKKNPILAALTAVVAAFLIITLILIPTIKAITSKPITSYPMGTNNAQPLRSYNVDANSWIYVVTDSANNIYDNPQLVSIEAQSPASAETSEPVNSYPMGTNNAQPLGSYRNILPYYITTPSGTGNP